MSAGTIRVLAGPAGAWQAKRGTAPAGLPIDWSLSVALHGKALLAIWHDIEPESWDEYMEWHTREHMPERLSNPGFTIGKRLISHALGRHRYGTIYCGEDIEVFRSPAYLERLNNPTDWSLRVQPAFRNFLRVACLRLASQGLGEGGAMATIRLDFAGDGGEERLRAGAEALAASLLAIRGVCCAHLAVARPEISSTRTRETEIRPEMRERSFDALVLLEGSGRPELEAIVAEAEDLIAMSGFGVGNPMTLVYNLAYQLSASDLPRT
jgi:hypothetical protein